MANRKKRRYTRPVRRTKNVEYNYYGKKEQIPDSIDFNEVTKRKTDNRTDDINDLLYEHTLGKRIRIERYKRRKSKKRIRNVPKNLDAFTAINTVLRSLQRGIPVRKLVRRRTKCQNYKAVRRKNYFMAKAMGTIKPRMFKTFRKHRC